MSAAIRIAGTLWEAKLGERRLALWRFLLELRDATSCIEVTAEQLAEGAAKAGWDAGSARVVARTLRFLDALGLTGVVALKVVLRPDAKATLPKRVAAKVRTLPLAGSGNHKNHSGGSLSNQNWRGKPETAEARARAKANRRQEKLRRMGRVNSSEASQ